MNQTECFRRYGNPKHTQKVSVFVKTDIKVRTLSGLENISFPRLFKILKVNLCLNFF
jgi:hypothetical protein